MLMHFLYDMQKGSGRQKCKVKVQKVMLMLWQGHDSVVTAAFLKISLILQFWEKNTFAYFKFPTGRDEGRCLANAQ